jgi:HlyD family secretion protein
MLELTAPAEDFSPPLLRLQRESPSPLPRLVLRVVLGLLAALLAWAVFGRLDIVAVAPGKLVPQTYLKVVQPAEAGIVQELLVREGDVVGAGQVLVRMDRRISEPIAVSWRTNWRSSGCSWRASMPNCRVSP